MRSCQRHRPAAITRLGRTTLIVYTELVFLVLCGSASKWMDVLIRQVEVVTLRHLAYNGYCLYQAACFAMSQIEGVRAV
ncbi:hypothetical protein F5Y07DRAFT_361442 [Xylaria sp. FL0933]|nr:hypothetical protein F5Y07DRAFT_361442 [Xylaria sp. FL0933]